MLTSITDIFQINIVLFYKICNIKEKINMAKITLIVAYGSDGIIGKNGNLPGWKLPYDMKHFKEMTEGKPVIMGRKTFESFLEKFRPLPNRSNIIITKNSDYVPSPTNDDTYVVKSLLGAIKEASKISNEIFIIGGGEIYKLALELDIIDKIIATEVEGDFEGDTFFNFDKDNWNKLVSTSYQKDEKNSHDFKIVEYYK